MMALAQEALMTPIRLLLLLFAATLLGAFPEPSRSLPGAFAHLQSRAAPADRASERRAVLVADGDRRVVGFNGQINGPLDA